MIYITKFRANDLNPSKGKQIEFNKNVVESFFHFMGDTCQATLECHSVEDKSIKQNIKATFKLSPSRGDYKIYQNSDGTPDLKDFFLSTLGLTTDNQSDYYAFKKKDEGHYILYYVPKASLFNEFYEIINGDQVLFMPTEAPYNYESIADIVKTYSNHLTALRTKPFLLLAGISGTGKSRIVRELAFATCPKYLQDEDGTTPGNYLMVEVKPNWHDSSSLLGYWSNINDKYMFTPFAEFLVKAMLHPSVPFFVCLDEMNLAPVEQYFAEFLSVLETRRHPAGEETKIQTGRLIEAKYFVDFASMKNFKNSSTGECARRFNNNKEIYQAMFSLDRVENIDEEVGNATTLLDEGLKLPDNVFIIGTVNMDDTTHQFSRKVIDRAMTIEMNGGALEDMFGNDCQLCYREDDDVLPLEKVQPKYITADEVLAQCSTLQQHPEFVELIKGKTEDGNLVEGSLPEKLNQVNIALKNTPFTVSYRVMNELVILFAVLLDNAEEDGIDVDMELFKGLMNTAFDRILLMKVLPRVEGDDEMFRISARERKQYNLKDTVSDDGENADFTKLDWLKQLAPQHPVETPSDSDTEPTEHESEMQTESPTYMAVDKLEEMIERLRRQNFTRYWP